MNNQPLPTFFISHGGGPWAYMEGDFRKNFALLERSLRDISQQIRPVPKAILVISGHWEKNDFTVMANPKPTMVYDYSGFPEHTYHVHYNAPGNAELAGEIVTLIKSKNIDCHLDEHRGFDHGTFVPLAIMYPQANIPVIQLSLKSDFDSSTHIKVGQSLAPLRNSGILIIGSGLSYHNLRRFDASAKEVSYQFDTWLQNTLNEPDPMIRQQNLINWAQAPGARLAHPREDHLLPLMVAFGAAFEEKSECIYHQQDFFGGITVSSFRFGAM